MVYSKELGRGNVVYLCNKYINAGCELGLVEKRVIYLIISKLDQREKIDSRKWFELSFSEYKTEFAKDTDNIVDLLEMGLDNLIDKKIKIKEEKQISVSLIIQQYQIDKFNKVIRLKFSDEFTKYISDLKEKFTKLIFEDFTKLESTYAIRLFELVKEYSFRKDRQFILFSQEIVNIFALPESCQEMRMFKAKILIPAIKHLLDRKVVKKLSFEDIKEGRKIIGFKFKI